MARYLITGGAGYIGSHLVILLTDQGHDCTVIDNLVTGHLEALPPKVKFLKTDIENSGALNLLLANGPWDGIFHFAALSIVSDNIKDPLLYFQKNTAASIGLINACIKHGIKKFVFSSTAALFSQQDGLISEQSLIKPLSPYGDSKWMIEKVLDWATQVHGLRSACLRYFNAAGSDIMGRIGEDHNPETHLIPLVIDTALGRRKELSIFGTDYPTRDGSAIKDYIHVTDLAYAHIAALKILDIKTNVKYNLGTGIGSSVLQVVLEVERITGNKIPLVYNSRRYGDSASLIADSSLIMKETGWFPKLSSLDGIITTTLEWRRNHPNGYNN